MNTFTALFLAITRYIIIQQSTEHGWKMAEHIQISETGMLTDSQLAIISMRIWLQL